jgi:hypothetical protein
MNGKEQRKYWLDTMLLIGGPVLNALAERKLKEQLPTKFHSDRSQFAHLEAFARLACGMAPWLELEGLEGEEEQLRARYAGLMLEAALYILGDPEYDRMRVGYAVHMFMDWYKGDGVYGDGKDFHWDYYNSFVIQPMLVDVVALFEQESEQYSALKPLILERAKRYATVLERIIAPDGTYPFIGRSIVYRFGAFQLLSQAALQHFLEEALPPAQVRCALTAVITRIMEYPGTLDESGWLRPGVYGYQPELAESYINTGSLYLCASVFLPLGLLPSDPFWSGEEMKWTSLKIAAGEDVMRDHALE